MNRRQWKKACKKAIAEIERRAPGEYVFEGADGEETVYAPAGYEPMRCEGKLGRKYTSPPKGTPIVWERCSIEGDEWECETALRILERLRYSQDTDWEALIAAESAGPAPSALPGQK